ncbi:hypothetical protein EGM70_03560 [Enterobacteriaceae bacterium 89]|nr:hypothetical protein [Enterobacteriaceae bacterium 89]
MKKVLAVLFVAAVSVAASSAVQACPKGEHLVGGTGAHHKGGQCVPMTSTKATKSMSAPAKAAPDMSKTKAKPAAKQ